jgi:hypothetical protein
MRGRRSLCERGHRNPNYGEKAPAEMFGAFFHPIWEDRDFFSRPSRGRLLLARGYIKNEGSVNRGP